MWAVRLSENCVVEPVLAERKLFVCPDCGERRMKRRRSPRCRSCARRRDYQKRNNGHFVDRRNRKS